MSEIEVFLDVQPGETRGMVMRGARFTHLLIQRDDALAPYRLGARSVGRVVEVDRGLKAAFVDLGARSPLNAGPLAFLPLRRDDTVKVGDKVEVVVTAEPRERKGPTLRLIGPAQGEPRLLTPGPSVEAELSAIAPGIPVLTGVAAIQASWDAEEEALADGDFFAEHGLDLAVQRTRAMISVDIDHVTLPGRDARKGRQQANLMGLSHAARQIRLKRWGGLVAIDLVGTAHEADAITRAAKAAFGGDPEVAFGPLNRFGVLMLSLPWRATPIEEVLHGPSGQATVLTEALDAVRRLRHAMLSDTTIARFILTCHPDEAAIAGRLVAQLGPRAHMRIDPGARPGHGKVEEA